MLFGHQISAITKPLFFFEIEHNNHIYGIHILWQAKKVGLLNFFRFFENNFIKIELYLSSNVSLKRAQKIISNPILTDFFKI